MFPRVPRAAVGEDARVLYFPSKGGKPILTRAFRLPPSAMLLPHLYRLVALPLVLLPAAFVLAACAPLYAPNAVNAPLLADGGEVQGAARLGSNGMGAQVTAALTDHVGAMANASAYPFDERAPAGEPPSDFRRHRLVEGALGYFDNGLFSKERVRYAVWAGYGRGQAEVISVIDPAVVPGPSVETDEGRFERFFVQVSAGGSRPLGERLQVESAMSLRAARVRFRESRGDATRGDRRGHFLEPAVSVRVGSAHLQLEMQSGLSLPLQSAEARGFGVEPFFLSMGVRVRFNALRLGDVF